MNAVVDPQSRVQVSCAYEELAREVERAIRREGFISTGPCPLTVVVDNPTGFALKILLRCPQKGKVIITSNPCPEYWEDLWNLEPQVLLAGGHSVSELVAALERASKGEYYRQIPKHSSELTPRERDVLRFCAMSRTNGEIAGELGISERTVQNNLTSIFTKLGLNHRGQAILYYWGIWDWLDRGGTALSRLA